MKIEFEINDILYREQIEEIVKETIRDEIKKYIFKIAQEEVIRNKKIIHEKIRKALLEFDYNILLFSVIISQIGETGFTASDICDLLKNKDNQ